MSYKLQTLIFLRNEWSLKQAKEYLKLHGYTHRDVDIKAHSYRFRQRDPVYHKNGKKIEYKTLTKYINGKAVYYTFMIF